jgi:hypothetical protein
MGWKHFHWRGYFLSFPTVSYLLNLSSYNSRKVLSKIASENYHWNLQKQTNSFFTQAGHTDELGWPTRLHTGAGAEKKKEKPAWQQGPGCQDRFNRNGIGGLLLPQPDCTASGRLGGGGAPGGSPERRRAVAAAPLGRLEQTAGRESFRNARNVRCPGSSTSSGKLDGRG